MRTIAPAKINWTLEVLGRRDDGYHEIRSVMQTIDLCDEVEVWPSNANSLEVIGDYTPAEDDLTLRAARTVGHSQFAIRLTKRIPVGSGLGGGSSDGAAVLRLIDKLVGNIDYDPTRDVDELGSDAPFFLHGGTALVRGRGDVIEEERDLPETWLVVMAPPLAVPEKTKTMYEALDAFEPNGGWRSGALMRLVRYRQPIDCDLLFNAFDAVVERVVPGIEEYRRAFRAAGARVIHLCGAGPSMFSPAASRDEADQVASRIDKQGAQVYVLKTLAAQEATTVTD